MVLKSFSLSGENVAFPPLSRHLPHLDFVFAPCGEDDEEERTLCCWSERTIVEDLNNVSISSILSNYFSYKECRGFPVEPGDFLPTRFIVVIDYVHSHAGAFHHDVGTKCCAH